MPFSALSKAFGQLPDPRIRNILILSILFAIVGYGVLVAGLSWGLGSLEATDIGWLDTVIDWAAGVMVMVIALIFFPAVVTIISGFFLESVARAVDARHYPHLAPGREIPVSEEIASAVRFTLAVIGLNILALPFYIFLPVLNLALFYLLNGYLLSREYFELAAHRRMSAEDAKALRKRNQGRLLLTGAAIAFLTTIPFVNLLAPIVGTAAMVHVLETLRGTRTAG